MRSAADSDEVDRPRVETRVHLHHADARRRIAGEHGASDDDALRRQVSRQSASFGEEVVQERAITLLDGGQQRTTSTRPCQERSLSLL